MWYRDLPFNPGAESVCENTGDEDMVDGRTQVVDMDMSGQRGIPMGTLLGRQADKAPNAPVLTFGEVTLTRLEFEQRANRRARALAELGVLQDDMVVIALPNGFEFYETSFALWKLGATPAPVSYRLPDIELNGIIDLIEPRLVIGVDATRRAGHHGLPHGFEPDARLSSAPLPERVAKYWKATTSGGSTGRPKVIVDHMPSVWDPDALVIGRKPGETVLNPGPLYHTGPFVIMHTAVVGSSHVINMSRFEALEWLQLVALHRVEWAYLVPTMMNRIGRLSERDQFDVSSLNMIVHMAGPCPPWLKRQWIDWLGAGRIWETYAGTEAVGGCMNSGHDWLAHPGTVGRPMGGCEVFILDENGAPLPSGDIGEIYFQASTTSGAGFHYLGGEPRASGSLKGYGDIGYLDNDGFLYLSDRRTDMFVTGGANIYPAEIEAAIERHPAVRSCVVVGLPDEEFGQIAHAVVDIPDEARGDVDPEALLQFLREHLVTYKLPRSMEFLSEPLRDDAGKVRRAAVRDAVIARLRRAN
jgi:bile acid-coenzyme A ligase